MKYFLLILLLTLSNIIYSQKSNEKLNYTIYYNLDFIWVPCGTASISLSDTICNNKNCKLVKAFGKTYDSFNYFYTVNEKFRSVIYKDAIISYERTSVEGDSVSYENYILKRNKYKSSYLDNKNSYTYTFNNDSCFDPISVSYNIRNLDYSKLKLNQKIYINILSNGTYIKTYIKYLGSIDHNKLLKFSVNTIKSNIFYGGENFFIHVKNDSTHTPVYIETRVRIGYLKAYLK